ncbi:MAG: aminotransferase class V-fold PLP-dependent enzyme [Phascolarctobacterium sp.]|nr:aminotransferase class V-fold PLP-dependent enzyme [Candidatus Phascolarctobacterium caballi]
MIFLDHNSTTPLLQCAYDDMKPYFCDLFYSPGGLQEICTSIADKIENTRKLIAGFISDQDGFLLFTSCATESNNFILKQGFFDIVITSPIEHPSLLKSAYFYHPDGVKKVKILSDGVIDVGDLECLLKENCSNKKVLVSIQHGNSVIHTLQDVEKISNLCLKYGAYLHVDATQTLGRISLIPNRADFITVSAHKCYGPKGIAALWIKKELLGKFGTPSLVGGGHHEKNLRAGTSNVPGIVGFGSAVNFMCTHLDQHAEHVKRLSKMFYTKFMKDIPNAILNGNKDMRIPGGLSFYVPGVDMRSILSSLPDIIISTGMACSTSGADPVMMELGGEELAKGSFRIQIGFENSENEIQQSVDALVTAIKQSKIKKCY